MDSESTLLVRAELLKIHVILKVLICRRYRTCAVRKMLRERSIKGYYASLIPRMRLSDVETFKNFHRMSPQNFDELLGYLGPNMNVPPNRYQEEITAGERLAVTLRYVKKTSQTNSNENRKYTRKIKTASTTKTRK